MGQAESGRQNNGRGNHRTGQTSPAGFIHAGCGRIVYKKILPSAGVCPGKIREDAIMHGKSGSDLIPLILGLDPGGLALELAQIVDASLTHASFTQDLNALYGRGV